MKKIISLILLFAMISSSCALAEVNESDSSLLFSFKYSDDGIIYDECENAEIELQEDTVKEHPSVYNVDTLISEAGDTKIFSSNYLQLKVSGERVNELVNSIDATYEFWMKYDPTAQYDPDNIPVAQNRTFMLINDGNDFRRQELQFQGINQDTHLLKARLSYSASSKGTNGFIDPSPKLPDMCGKWSHLVCVRQTEVGVNRVNVIVYLDGVEIKRLRSVPEDISVLGEAENSVMYLLGNTPEIQVGTIKMYNRALSADDISQAYSSSKANYISLPEEMAFLEASAEGGTESEPAEINMYAEELTLKFSNQIDESSIEDIVIEDKDGNVISDASISVNDKKAVVVKFGKLNADEPYILRIPDTVASRNGYTIDESITYYYIAKDKRTPLKLISYDNKTRLGLEGGQIRLKFSDSLNCETVEAAVTFTDENGVELDCDAYIDPSDEKTILVDYGKLKTDAKYILTISKALETKYEMKPESDITINYVSENPLLLTEEDFSEYDIGQSFQQSELGYLILSQYPEAQYIACTENGEKYLEVAAQQMHQYCQLTYKFGTPLTSGQSAVIEAKIKRWGTSTYSSNVGRVNGAGGTESINCTNSGEGLLGTDKVDTDKDGFFDIKIIVKRDTDGYYYTETYYSVGGNERKIVKKFASKAIVSVSNVNIYNIYPSNVPTSDYPDRIGMKSLKVCLKEEPYVKASNLSGYDPKLSEPIWVDLSSAATAETVNTDNIYLLDKKKNTQIEWEITSYDEELGRVYFDVNKQYLNYAGEYEIVCSGLETSEGIRTQLPIGATFTAAPYPIQLNGEAILEYSNGKVHLNANLIGSSSSKLEAVVILYDNNGRIQEITSEAAEWSGTNGNVSAEISAENVTNGYYARAYLIDITNNAFAPITEIPVELFINI